MTKEVDGREKELTHQSHREALCEHLEQVKNLTPSFISSIKIFLLTITQQQPRDNHDGQNRAMICNCIEQNKNYLIQSLTHEINEIIRILQLTTYDEDEWMNDEITLVKQKLVLI